MPALPQLAAQGEWRLSLNSDRLPQRVALIYRGTIAAGDRPGMHEFAAPRWARFRLRKRSGRSPVRPGSLPALRRKRADRPVESAVDPLPPHRRNDRTIGRAVFRGQRGNRALVSTPRAQLGRRPGRGVAGMAADLPDRPGRAMRKEMESLDQRQQQFAEHLEMSDVLRQLLAASPQAYEPAEWWGETLFDPAAAVRFEQDGRLTSLQLNYDWAESSQSLKRIGTCAATVALLIWQFGEFGKTTGKSCFVAAPSSGHAAGAAIGLIWWLWLSRSWLGLTIILASVASWGWSRRIAPRPRPTPGSVMPASTPPS